MLGSIDIRRFIAGRVNADGMTVLYVNPNYLRLIPVIDVEGRSVHVEETETAITILSPMEADRDSAVKAFFQKERTSRLELEQKYAVPRNTDNNNVQIIRIKPSQKLFTFLPGEEYYENAIICVITEKNSLITERVCITGSGILDPMKIYIGKGSDAYKNSISDKLSELELDDNILSIVSIEQSIHALQSEFRYRAVALGVAMGFLLILQLMSNVLVFRIYIKRKIPLIVLKYISGYSAFRQYTIFYSIAILQIIATILICYVNQIRFEFGLAWCLLDITEYYLLKKITFRCKERTRVEYIKGVHS